MNAIVGEWVFRHVGGCLIDTPDLEPIPSGWRWIATVWPDPTLPDGWGALEWEPGERGWQLPITLAAGDVVEFGITTLDPNGRPRPEPTHRWYGWVHHGTDVALVIHGPYPHPRPAAADARELIDEIRLDQLDPPRDALIEAAGQADHGNR